LTKNRTVPIIKAEIKTLMRKVGFWKLSRETMVGGNSWVAKNWKWPL